MSDAATLVAREWLYERSLSLEHTEDLAAMLEAYAAEQTADEAAKHADCCVDREELAALRAALLRAINLLTAQHTSWLVVGRQRHQSHNEQRCEVCRFLAAPEAAP